MASRPEAAYAASEVTPKWVLISWHHLLPSSLIIPASRPRAQHIDRRPVRVLVETMGTRFAIALAIVSAVPAALVHFGGIGVAVPIATLFYGIAILAASFAMAWGAEAAERDIPRALAMSAVALLAVLPEYAVDIVFA